jgi:hypothetical protein
MASVDKMGLAAGALAKLAGLTQTTAQIMYVARRK